MKKLMIILALVPCIIFVKGQGLRFEDSLSWEQIQQKAKAENKYIFVDCYATWCGPCKEMDRVVYPDRGVGDFFNERFISVKLQMDTSKKDDLRAQQWYPVAQDFQNAYRITAYPSLLFFSPDGVVVHKGVGYKDSAGLIDLGMNATEPTKQFYTLLKKYQSGSLEKDSLKSLALAAKDLEENELAIKIGNDYINSLTEEQLYRPDNLDFLYDFTKTSKQRGFAIFRDNAAKVTGIEPKLTKIYIDGRLHGIINDEAIKPFAKSKNGKPDWKRIEENIKSFGALGEQAYSDFKPGLIFNAEINPELKRNPDWNYILPIIEKQHAGKGEEFLIGCSIIFYRRGLLNGTEKDCRNLIPAAQLYAKKYYSFLTSNPLDEWAWAIFEHSTKKEDLLQGLAWSDSSIKLSPKQNAVYLSAAYLDTHSNLLYKLGRVSEALASEEKAVNLDPNNKGISANYQKMKKGEATWPKP